jgi:hypothetical protein
VTAVAWQLCVQVPN